MLARQLPVRVRAMLLVLLLSLTTTGEVVTEARNLFPVGNAAQRSPAVARPRPRPRQPTMKTFAASLAKSSASGSRLAKSRRSKEVDRNAHESTRRPRSTPQPSMSATTHLIRLQCVQVRWKLSFSTHGSPDEWPLWNASSQLSWALTSNHSPCLCRHIRGQGTSAVRCLSNFGLFCPNTTTCCCG
ncbi:hypothetical protein HDK77DRAFT_267097 [Phyllosticta capitalensis]